MRQIRGSGATRQKASTAFTVDHRPSIARSLEYFRRRPQGHLRCWSLRRSADVRGRASGRVVRHAVGRVVGRVVAHAVGRVTGRVIGQTSVVPSVAPSVAPSVVPLLVRRMLR